jgi:hypothetical protein
VLSSLFKGLVFVHSTVLLIVGFLPLLLQSFVQVYYISDKLLSHAVPTSSRGSKDATFESFVRDYWRFF